MRVGTGEHGWVGWVGHARAETGQPTCEMPNIISSCCMAVLMVRLGRRPLAMSYRKSLRRGSGLGQPDSFGGGRRGSVPTVVSANEQGEEDVEVGRFLDAVPDARPAGVVGVRSSTPVRAGRAGRAGPRGQLTAGRQSACAPPRSCRSRSRSSCRGLSGSGAGRTGSGAGRAMSAEHACRAVLTSADHAVTVTPTERSLHTRDASACTNAW